MNSLIFAGRFRTLLSGSNLNKVKSLVILSPKNINFSTSIAPYRLCQNQLLLLSKSFASVQLSRPLGNVRLYANDATSVPHHTKESHGNIWVAERLVSVLILFFIPAILTDPILHDLEVMINLLIAAHVHWGLEAIFKDYLRPSVVGNVIPKFCDVYAGLFSIYLAVGLVWISMYGIGVSNTIKHLWSLDPNVVRD